MWSPQPSSIDFFFAHVRRLWAWAEYHGDSRLHRGRGTAPRAVRPFLRKARLEHTIIRNQTPPQLATEKRRGVWGFS